MMKDHSMSEYLSRMQIFKDNLKRARAMGPGYGDTKFAHYTKEEFKRKMTPVSVHPKDIHHDETLRNGTEFKDV